MNAVQAINALEMTLNENRVFTVDFSNWIHSREKIIGVSSVSLTPGTGAPTVSEVGYAANGKSVSFRIDATGGNVTPTRYTLSVIVTTQKALHSSSGSVEQTIEARGYLNVCR